MTSKITIISYIGTYYAIGAAWILTLANYFAIGWFNGYLDKYYIDSWKVWFSIVIVFNGLGNFALATMRYRIGERSWFGSLFENLKWTFMLAIFLGGLSLHVSQALLSHMFEINMTWVSRYQRSHLSQPSSTDTCSLHRVQPRKKPSPQTSSKKCPRSSGGSSSA